MPPKIALVISLSFIFIFIKRDLKYHSNLSKSLWLPLIWALSLASKSFYGWFHLGMEIDPSNFSVAEGNPFDRNILIIFICAGIVILNKRKDDLKNIIKNNKYLLLFIVYAGLSTMWSDFAFIAFKRYIRLLGLVIMALVIVTEREPQAAISAILRRCAYVLLPLSYLFCKYYPVYGRYYNRWTYEVGYCGVGANKNELGLLCLYTGLYLLWEIVRPIPNKKILTMDNLIHGGLLASALYMLKIANSSTSTLCFLIGAIIIVYTRIPAIRIAPQKILKSMASFGGFAIVVQILFDVKSSIIIALGRRPDLTDRVPLWNALLKMHTNPLFGTGYSSFWLGARKSYIECLGFPLSQAHNGYIETYINLGMIGLFLLFCIFISGVHDISKQVLSQYDYATLRLCCAITFLLYNYTEGALPGAGFVTFLFIVMMLNLPRQDSFSYNMN